MFSIHAKRLGALFLVLAFSVSVCSAQTQAKFSDAEEAAIKQSVARFSDAFNHHDAQACAARYTDDGDFVGIAGQFSHGHKELLEHYNGIFNGYLKAVRSTFVVIRIRFLAPNMAGVDFTWKAEGALAPDGSEAPVRNGLINLVMTRHNGQWLFTTYHEAMFPPPAPK